MVKQGSESPPDEPAMSGSSEELFQIIDESGEGFGFDLTPDTLAKPIMIGTATLFGVGMLAGIPLGFAMGRAEETGKGAKGVTKVRPSLDGIKFAATTFGLGTLLCASMGAVAFYGVKQYYQVESFEQFGQVMRETVPAHRMEMEQTLSPVLDSVRRSAGDNLPASMQNLRRRFEHSRFGRWIKSQVDASVTITDEAETRDNSEAHRQLR